MAQRLKVVAGSVITVLTFTYLGLSGLKESVSYYQTVPELYASKDKAYERRLRVAGDVEAGSIRREGKVVHFVIGKDRQSLSVRYVGSEPLPDTFHDYATTVVDGRYGRDGVFTATGVQAKCASKYEKESAAGIRPAK